MNIPPIQAIGPIQFTLPKQLQLSNQIPVYIFNDDKNPILKLDIVFDAGRWTEEQKLAADAMAALSKSGTNELSSFEINEEIDQLGATLKIGTGFNTCTLSISCLSKFLEPC
ncbi:MAG: insulinase family protein, partial [Bacteroidetes bacterium]|nr:insulinase family protein [Bacteroidota bacterium]